MHTKSNCKAVAVFACVFERASVKIKNVQLSLRQSFCEISYSARLSSPKWLFFNKYVCIFIGRLLSTREGSTERKKYDGSSHRHRLGG